LVTNTSGRGGLGDEVVDAKIEDDLGELTIRLARVHDPRGDLLTPRLGDGRRAQREAGVLRVEVDVAHHDVELSGLQLVKRLLIRPRGPHVEASLEQAQLEDRRVFGIGVDEQHAVAVVEQLRAEVVSRDLRLDQIDDRWVEHRASRLAQELDRLRRLEHASRRVTRVGRQIAVAVDDGQDARAEGDVFAGHPQREALSVEALVHGRHRALRVRVQRDSLEEALGHVGHLLRGCAVPVVFGDVERREVVRAGLADVVEVRGDDVRRGLRGRQAHAVAHPPHEPSALRRVPSEIGSGGLEEAHEHIEGLQVVGRERRRLLGRRSLRSLRRRGRLASRRSPRVALAMGDLVFVEIDVVLLGVEIVEIVDRREGLSALRLARRARHRDLATTRLVAERLRRHRLRGHRLRGHRLRGHRLRGHRLRGHRLRGHRAARPRHSSGHPWRHRPAHAWWHPPGHPRHAWHACHLRHGLEGRLEAVAVLDEGGRAADAGVDVARARGRPPGPCAPTAVGDRAAPTEAIDLQRHLVAASHDLNEEAGVVVVRALDGGADRGGSRDQRDHLSDTSRDLDLVEHREVVRIGRHDVERAAGVVIEDGQDAPLLAQLLGQDVDELLIDVGLVQLLRRDEPRVVVRRDEAKQLGLGDHVVVDQGVLAPPAVKP
jgi:hypothetical protein